MATISLIATTVSTPSNLYTALLTTLAAPLPIVYFSFFYNKKVTIILAGIILNFVRLFCGLLSCLIPFLSIIKSTLGKISFDSYLNQYKMVHHQRLILQRLKFQLEVHRWQLKLLLHFIIIHHLSLKIFILFNNDMLTFLYYDF